MIPGFSTSLGWKSKWKYYMANSKEWRSNNVNVIELNCKVVKKWQPPSQFLHEPPLPPPLLKGGGGIVTTATTSQNNLIGEKYEFYDFMTIYVFSMIFYANFMIFHFFMIYILCLLRSLFFLKILYLFFGLNVSFHIWIIYK